MLTKRARKTVTPYALLAAKLRDWTPPDGLSLKSYAVRSGPLELTFEVILSCQCEAEERLSVRSMVSRRAWNDSKVDRDVTVENVLARMYEEAEQRMVEHAGARA
jgi:hypothetical protein